MALGALITFTPPEAVLDEGIDPSLVTRLAVIGDSDFANNQHFRNGNNSDLFLTIVNWP